ncbi:putative glycolipid-binding domain-containing protein [Halocatena marina]|uniref:putative glycolipid-binding domain-containing protein n=1 Tax=Halocatena marina TaxID=2934937 RepID=UPI00200DA17D|nr:putative glycolipid-binding domain-containing protein [Halocatena marina]
MNRDVYWTPTVGVGIESLHLIEDSAGVDVESVVVGSAEDESFRIRYEIECDRRYRVRRVEVATLDRESASISLRADTEGNWTNGNGGPMTILDGCTDVDISVTPFTNTLPIRRLELNQGESTEIETVYISVPDLHVETAIQKYTCLDPLDQDSGRYRYESVTSGFTAELPVDADGLVTDYPDLFDRVFPPE